VTEPKKATRRGWTAQDLPQVKDDPELWTAADAARLLGPPELTTDQVRQLVRMLRLTPVGKRQTGGEHVGGRHARVYRAEALIKAFDDLYKQQAPED
jgi:hypothetical protein